MLRSTNADAYNGLQWIRNNRGMFHSEVLGPLVLQISVPTPHHAAIVEKAIPRTALTAFVAQNEVRRPVLRVCSSIGDACLCCLHT